MLMAKIREDASRLSANETPEPDASPAPANPEPAAKSKTPGQGTTEPDATSAPEASEPEVTPARVSHDVVPTPVTPEPEATPEHVASPAPCLTWRLGLVRCQLRRRLSLRTHAPMTPEL